MSDIPVGHHRVDTSKRTWLIASGCAGAVGGAAVVVPFVSTFQPSERAKAAGAPVEVDIAALKPGEKLTVEWRGKPVWILTAHARAGSRTSQARWPVGRSRSQSAIRTNSRLAYARNEGALDQARVPGGGRDLLAPGLLAHRQVAGRARNPRYPTTGRAVSCVLAMGRPSTLPVVCSRTNRRRTTSRCHRTFTSSDSRLLIGEDKKA